MILNAIPRFSPKRQLEKLIQRQQTKFERIIGIVRVVGNTVGRIDCLDFEQLTVVRSARTLLCPMSLALQNFA